MSQGRILNLIGKNFGKLTVIATAPNRGRHTTWLCRCECGTEKVIATRDLQRGCAVTCNTKGKHPKHQPGEGAFNSYYSQMRYGAIKRGYAWNLTKEQVKHINKQACFYCGCEPSQKVDAKKHQMIGDYIYNGIDRIDNSLGYYWENCVPCCGVCNWMKSNLSLQEFKNHIHKIFLTLHSTHT